MLTEHCYRVARNNQYEKKNLLLVIPIFSQNQLRFLQGGIVALVRPHHGLDKSFFRHRSMQTCYRQVNKVSEDYLSSICWFCLDDMYQFISISHPDDVKDRKKRRCARSHAVKQALEVKRKLQQKSRNNFHILSSQEYAQKLADKQAYTRTLVAPPPVLSAGILDPFQTLAVDSSRLQMFLGECTILLATHSCFEQTYIIRAR